MKEKLRELRTLAVDDLPSSRVSNMQNGTCPLGYGLNDVSLQYIRSWVYPELDIHRRPWPQANRTALGK
jgi:hypothetical protein